MFLHQAAWPEIRIVLKAVIAGPGHETGGLEPLITGKGLGLVQRAAGDGGNAQRLDLAILGRAPVKGQFIGLVGGHPLQRAADDRRRIGTDRNGQRRVQDLIVGNDQNRIGVIGCRTRIVAQGAQPAGHVAA